MTSCDRKLEIEAAKHIAESYDVGRWLKGYIRGKLKADPVFAAGLGELKMRPGPVVDLGCGLGLMGMWLRRFGCESPYTGCDLSGWKIEAGRRAFQKMRLQDISLHEADMTTFPLEDASTICAFDVLHYLPQETQAKLVCKLASAAKSGSVVLIRNGVSGCGWRSTMTSLEEYWTRATKWIRGGAINFPSLEPLLAQFESQGCKVEFRPLWGKTLFSSYWFRLS
jgi:cyclopropane fatty-acyl-phospholipid synthase-like methyltransferase